MKKTNKTQKVIQHLKKKGSITSWQAIKLYGETRLAAVVHNLRERGYMIDSLWMEDTDRYGNVSRYVKYVLKEK